MLFALAYTWLRLLLDLVDVRLRVHDPEAEPASSPAPASRRTPSGQAAAVEYGGSDDHAALSQLVNAGAIPDPRSRCQVDSRDCGDIVQQISAMRSAVDRLGYELVLTNLRACLTATDLTPRSEDEIEKALSALSGLRS